MRKVHVGFLLILALLIADRTAFIAEAAAINFPANLIIKPFDPSIGDQTYPLAASRWRAELIDTKVEPKTQFSGFRKTIEIPEEVSRASLFLIGGAPAFGEFKIYVNGRLISSGKENWIGGWNVQDNLYCDVSREIGQGKNVIAVEIGRTTSYGGRTGGIVLEGAAIGKSGRTYYFQSDATWKGINEPQGAWYAKDYDDSGWPVAASSGNYGKFTYGANAESMHLDAPYQGPIGISHPERRSPIFRSAEDFKLTVAAPVYRDDKAAPVYEYRVTDSFTGSEINSGKLADPTQKGDVWLYPFAKRAPAGSVYNLNLKLIRPSGEPVDFRDFEFVITGKIAQREVPPQEIADESRWELVDTINCYDPQDPHPFIDVKNGPENGRIVKSPLGDYRETGPTYADFFSYAFKIRQPGVPHKVVVEYPDDTYRTGSFMVFENPNLYLATPRRGYYKERAVNRAAGGSSTGEPYPVTNTLKKWESIYFPAVDEATVLVGNPSPKSGSTARAAARRIMVYQLKEKTLPAVKAPATSERLIGMWEERPAMLSPLRFCSSPEGERFTEMLCYIPHQGFYKAWYALLCNQIQYMRYCGQNAYLPGFFMYYYPNVHLTSGVYDPAEGGWPLHKYPRETLDIMSAMFAENGLSLIPVIEFNGMKKSLKDYTDEEVLKGAPTLMQVDRKGGQGVTWMGKTPNPLQPVIREQYLRLLDDIVKNYGSLEAIKGIFFMSSNYGWMPSWMGNRWQQESDPPFSYDDYTIIQFEKDTGLKVPGNAGEAGRFEARYQWLNNVAREQWLSWRCRKIAELHQEIVQHLKKGRSDLKLFVSGTDQQDGWDFTLPFYRNNANVVPVADIGGLDGRLFATHGRAPVRECFNSQITNRYSIPAVTPGVKAGAWVMDGFYEPNFSVPKETNWYWRGQIMAAYAPASGRNFLAPFTTPSSVKPPALYTFGNCDSDDFSGNEPEQAEFNSHYLNLPAGEYTTLQGNGTDRNISIQELRSEKGSVIYVANPSPWTVEGTLQLTSVSEVREPVSDETTRLKAGALPLKLKPYETKILELSGSGRVRAATMIASSDSQDFVQKTADYLDGFSPDSVENIVGLKEVYLTLKEAVVRRDAVKAWLLRNDLERISLTGVRKDSLDVWMVCGPFDNEKSAGFDAVYPPEEEVLAGSVDYGQKYAGKNGIGVRWQEVKANRGYLDFLNLFPKEEWAVVYALRYVYSPNRQAITLSLGSDDGIKVWLNGRLVHSHLIARASAPGQDRIPVKLREGWNQVLVKVENQVGGWNLVFGISDQFGNPMPGLKTATAPPKMQVTP